MQSYRGLRNLAVALPVALAMAGSAYAQRNPQLREGMYETRDQKRNCLVMRDDDSHDLYEECEDASRKPALRTTVINGKLYSFRYANGREIEIRNANRQQRDEVQKRRNATVEAVQNNMTMGIGHFR